MVENKHIKSSHEVKRLRITIYHRLAFTKYINNLCNTINKTFENFDKNKEIFRGANCELFMKILYTNY